ncbi:unnamed protein product [Tilletia controversa]|uniref:Vacuolar protein sorting-associated protein 74 n=3 Tax=Tilletia TaxID=13289 RepID=A0A8X7N264_9BASI|nr:hypothetical protein CF336_g262 [Tilletia laevis]KAE8205529.1 hypothetical protein CF328_g440 [Tilletia controversa]KAE8265487.1 hypothetical protein A4X03_0g232 [Tilletia caries]KAE8208739.1 hypothetical protein CF335_g193 [Tilletia laevis]KAE8256155.1 hypothetical protein A4X06_0g42 [Tilletia controversa]
MASGSNSNNVSGLSRRRPVGAGASSATYGGTYYSADPDEELGGTPLNASPNPSGGNGNGHQSSAANTYSARSSIGSAPIASDPRDLQDESEVAAHPRLTLMEEILLLGLKDRQGYLSFWNDSISFALRACIIIELALRKRIAVVREPTRRRFDVQDRLVEVVNPKGTGEVLLDETLKMMRTSELMSTAQWVDLLSGETWNVMKIGYQLKQVRERLAKGLVDKGVLRTEKRNFLLFDMATHPIEDTAAKDSVLRRMLMLLTSNSPSVHPDSFYREDENLLAGRTRAGGSSRHRDEDLNYYGGGGEAGPSHAGMGNGSPAPNSGGAPPNSGKRIAFRMTRSLCLLCCAFSANVLENALNHLSYDARELAFQKADDLMADFAQWPMAPHSGGGGIGGSGPPAGGGLSSNGSSSSPSAGPGRSGKGIQVRPGIGEGSVLSSDSGNGGRRQEVNMGVGVEELARAIRAEYAEQGNENQYEVIAGVLHVLSRMDALI